MTVTAVLRPPVLDLGCCFPACPVVDFPKMTLQLFLLVAAAATASLRRIAAAILRHLRPWECRLCRHPPPCGTRRGSERP